MSKDGFVHGRLSGPPVARDQFDELDVWRGQTVWVRARRKRVFAA